MWCFYFEFINPVILRLLQSKSFYILIFCLSANEIFAQAGHLWLNRAIEQKIEARLMADGLPDHLSMRPFALRDIDSIFQATADTSFLLPELGRDFWAAPSKGKWKMDVAPLLDAQFGYSNRNQGVYRALPGLAANIRLGKTLSFYGDVFAGSEKPAEYIDSFINSTGVIPAMGKNRSSDGNPSIANPTARLSYAPGDIFQFELGYGKNFIGQGYRSVFLSDVASNYPYLKITTDVWHFKYVNIFSMLEGTDLKTGKPTDFQKKYTTTHYLSWAVSPRFNIGLFETIVWQGHDTLSNRGVDPNYLNPIIFYRPVEYSVGSPDNALIGFDLSFKALKKVRLYSQVLFDEFLLSAFRDGNGWWANKWATQIGFVAYDFAAVKGLNIQGEFNCARPFTYTHGSPLQNFGHYNQPLAHQLGTNFYEGILTGYYEKGNWYGEATIVYSEYGRDPDSLNFGGDIFKSYVNPAMQYGNEIGQGVKTDLYRQTISMGYILNRNLNLRAGVSYTLRHEDTEGVGIKNEHILGIFFATQLYKSGAVF